MQLTPLVSIDYTVLFLLIAFVVVCASGVMCLIHKYRVRRNSINNRISNLENKMKNLESK